MHYVYILYSPSSGKYYVGESGNVDERLRGHNSGLFIGASTAFANDWKVCLVLKTGDRVGARKIEKYIKSMKSKRFITSLVTNKLYFDYFKELVFKKFRIRIME
jgi:putative endonuclease